MHPPSVDSLARSLRDTGLPHPVLVDIAREAIASGDHTTATERAERFRRTLLQPVLNATGVLLHTNLGRAPLSVEPQRAGYSNVEFRLADGARGSRQDHAGALLARASGAEAAMVVNNCASAVLLVLAALATGRKAAVSRGELVEIGGAFRVPDVMAQSGVDLVEVGTTNRTRRADFEQAIELHGEDLALVMKVHQSNYKIVGFTETVEVEGLTEIGRPVVADIGSGLLDAACPWLPDGPPAWLAEEPAARQTLAAGADLITFSGDKLLGGPQAGIIAGSADLVRSCARHPLARALRPGGLVLGELQRLALCYLDRRGHDIPFWKLATTPVAELRARAEALDAQRAGPTVAVPGGGTLPTVEIPSYGIHLPGDHGRQLRERPLPIAARVHEDTTIIDLRTIWREDDELIADALAELPCTS